MIKFQALGIVWIQVENKKIKMLFKLFKIINSHITDSYFRSGGGVIR